MKIIVRSIFLLSLLVAISAMTGQKVKKVVFFGDSITEAGVDPDGFISIMKERIKSKGIDNQYELHGAGIGGNKVYDLYLRMEEDVISKNPDIVFIWIGVNDVWHKQLTGTGTDADKFEKFYVAIINKLQAAHCKVVLCTPATIGERTDYSNQQDGDLNRYTQIIRGLASRYQCALIDFRVIFHEYDLKNNPENKATGILTKDGVHLNSLGNQLVADKMMDALATLN